MILLQRQMIQHIRKVINMRVRFQTLLRLTVTMTLAATIAVTIASCESSNSSKSPTVSHGPGDGHNHGSNAPAIDWCPEHRVPESECTRCHPERADQWKSRPGMWCEEHGVPEPHCYQCHPDIKFSQEQQYLDQIERSEIKASDEVRPVSSSSPKLATSIYRPNAPNCATDEAVIQLSSSQAAERAGLTVAPVSESRSAEHIEAVGEVEFDPTASTAVTSLVGGTLVQWLVNVGDAVKAGQTLAYLESLEGATLRAEYVEARAQLEFARTEFERQQRLFNNDLTSQREFQDAQTAHSRSAAVFERASSALRAIGADSDGGGALIPIRSRQRGVLAEQRVALGQVLEAGTSIGLIAEPGKLWVEALVKENDLSLIHAGHHATLSLDGGARGRTMGDVIWISAAVDPVTRMGRVRIRPRPNGTPLYAHQFVEVAIETDQAENSILIAREAVQWEGCCNVVFVSETKDRFRPRKVQVQYATGDQYAVVGLHEGEDVVTRGSYLLKTELMKEGLGAGCCGRLE
jgi:cobalt-zinc-cadmium efflux system membrane fusion protein